MLDRYFERVYRYVAQRVGTRQDAEDVTSVVFVEAMESLDHYHERGSFAGWLFTIARRKVADHYRRSGAETSLEMVDRDALVSEAGVPEARAALDERLCHLDRALRSLAPEKQEILALRFFAGLRYREIASILGKGESAAKMMVYRALDTLRKALLVVEEGQNVPRE